MRRLFLLIAAVMAAVAANAQQRLPVRPAAETTQSVSLNIPLDVHYAYEYPLARRVALVGRAGLDAGAAWGSDIIHDDLVVLFIAPSIDIEPRFYYGLDRRAAHGRSTAGNAGSFLAMQMKSIMPVGYVSDSDMTVDGVTVLTPMWGLRRVWSGHWLFEFTAGAAFVWNWEWESGFGSTSHLGVRFGYSF
jgi:hypothetical protein